MGDVNVEYEISARDRARETFESIIGGTKRVDAAFSVLKKGLAGLAAFEISRRLIGQIDELANSLDELNDRALRENVLVDELDRMEFVAGQAGITVDDLANAAKFAQRNLAEAAEGSKAAIAAFARLGVEIRTPSGELKTFEQVLLEAADQMPRLEARGIATAAAMDVFGKAGDRLLPLLKEGSDAIRAQILDAERLGTRYSDLTKLGDDYNDAQARWERAFRRLGDAISREVLPPLTQLQNFLADQLSGQLETSSEQVNQFVLDMQLKGASPDQIFAALQTRLEVIGERMSQVRRDVEAFTRIDAQDAWPLPSAENKQARQELVDLAVEEDAIEEAIARVLTLIAATRERSLAAAELEAEAIKKQQREAAKLFEAEFAAQQRFGVETFAVFEALQRKKEEFRQDPISPFDVTGQDAGDFFPLPTDFTDQLAAANKGWDDMDRAVAIVGESIAFDLGGSLRDFLDGAVTAAELFESTWKNAISNVADALATRGLMDLLLGPKFAGGGQVGGLLGSIFNSSAGTNTAQGVAAPVLINQWNSMVPAGPEDYIRLNVASAEANRELARFSAAGVAV